MDLSNDPIILKTVGKGLVFPIELDENGSATLECSTELIASNIKINLSWPRFSRFFLAEYGGGLDEILDEPNDDVLSGIANTFVKRSLAEYTPYLKDLQVLFERTSEVSAKLSISYSISNTKIKETLQYP